MARTKTTTRRRRTSGRKSTRTARRTSGESRGRRTAARRTRKSRGRRYSEGASRKIGKVMHEHKEGTLRSGSTGKKVRNRRQAIAIGISEARAAGKKVPKRRSGTTGRARRSSAKSAGRRGKR